MPEAAPSPHPELRRSLGLPHATAIVVGIIVGSSIFVQPSEITRLVPGTRAAMLVWLSAGLLTLCGALVCAELSRSFPETGGVYVFLRRMFPAPVAFLWGWMMFWSMHSGIIAAIAVILARYAAFFLPLGDWGMRALAIAAIILLSLLNYLGVKPAGAVQVMLTTIKVIALVGLAAVIFAFGTHAHTAVAIQQIGQALPPLREIGVAIGAGLFAFGGWHMVTYSAGETRAPERTLPRALLVGTLVVTGCYMLLNAAYQYVLPPADIATSTRVASTAAERVFGSGVAGAISLLVIVSALGSLNGIILAGPRVYLAMARDGLAFRWMAALHPEHRTPHLAIAAQAAVASALLATNSYRQLFTRVVYTEWIFFSLLAVGLIVRGRSLPVRPRPVMLAIAAVFAVVAAAIALNQAAADLHGASWGLALLLLGLPAYWIRKRVHDS